MQDNTEAAWDSGVL